MSYEALEISWISCALLFAVAQAVLIVVITCSPLNVDRAIDYYRWVKTPLDIMLRISYLPLTFAIIVNWAYFPLQTEYTVGGYTVASVITVLGITTAIMSYILMRRALLSRFKPDS